jgi:hypothetical protein
MSRENSALCRHDKLCIIRTPAAPKGVRSECSTAGLRRGKQGRGSYLPAAIGEGYRHSVEAEVAHRELMTVPHEQHCPAYPVMSWRSSSTRGLMVVS